MIEQTQVGAIQILRTSPGPVGLVVSEVNVFNMPVVFRNIAHLRPVIDGPTGQKLPDRISGRPARMVGLAWMDGGSRGLYTHQWHELPRLLHRTVKTVTVVKVLIGLAGCFGYPMTLMQIPLKVTAFFTGLSDPGAWFRG